MSSNNTQLTKASGYNTKNMTFGKPKAGSLGAVSFLRIPIGTKNADGSFGDLVLSVPKVYSFGLSVNTNMQTGKPDGYILPLCLYSKDGPSQEEKDFVQTFNDVVERARQHVLDIKVSIGKYELEAAELKKMNPLYIKKDKKTGKPEDGAGPVLYLKVMQKNKKSERGSSSESQEKVISTLFYDEKGRDIDPMSLMEKHGFATAAIKVESIFIGAKISLQVKVYETEYQIIDNNPRRLRRPTNDTVIHGLEDAPSEENSVRQPINEDESEEDENENGSVTGSPPTTPKASVAAVIPSAPVKASKPVRKLPSKK